MNQHYRGPYNTSSLDRRACKQRGMKKVLRERGRLIPPLKFFKLKSLFCGDFFLKATLVNEHLFF